MRGRNIREDDERRKVKPLIDVGLAVRLGELAQDGFSYRLIPDPGND